MAVERHGRVGNRHGLHNDVTRAAHDGVEQPFAAEQNIFRALDALQLHRAGGVHRGKIALPSISRKTMPLPENFCIKKPSPPNRAPPMRCWKNTDTSTLPHDARNAPFWAMMGRSGVISIALMEPGNEDANAISPGFFAT